MDLPQEETIPTNISQLIELDLLCDKKKKSDSDSDEEVRGKGGRVMEIMPVEVFPPFLTNAVCHCLSVRRRRCREETRTRRRGGGTKEPSRCYTAFRCA